VGVLEKWEIKTLLSDRTMYPPLLMTSLRAFRSSGYFATGLQKFQAWPAQSSTVNAMWCAVMVQATVGPQALTASTAARVVACSSTIRSLGNRS